ncbi:MAG TPA: N-acetylmuramoyl-L-alanine amidase [Gemmatimonadales bacterium]|nr:N-acetylmuramoyl-L-alanine amidase [Gemmatimonadales bacterium]
MEAAAAGRLHGLKVAVDVQHLWKPPPRDRDRGAVFVVDGLHVAEADAALIYASVLARWLEGRGAQVLENQPSTGIFVGSYPQRNRAAIAWGANLYLACHLNAGGGHYAALEFMSLTEGKRVAELMGEELVRQLPGLGTCRAMSLSSTSRGAVCIETCASLMPALIVEPFFGDSPATQPFLTNPGLIQVGAAIGTAVAAWWESIQPVA